jgi:protein tyrosine/serine phosphatase
MRSDGGMQWTRLFKKMALGAGLLVLAGGVFLGQQFLRGNFHEVVPGEFYRSAQPSGADIAYYAKTYGIKTVINLRGASKKGSQWYVDEIRESKALGLNHVDFAMSAARELNATQMADLTRIMRDAPKPILVHCMSGVDRTGLASVLYLQQIAGVDEETAEWQLSLIYGHFSIPFVNRAYAMDESWEAFEKAIGLES